MQLPTVGSPGQRTRHKAKSAPRQARMCVCWCVCAPCRAAEHVVGGPAHPRAAPERGGVPEHANAGKRFCAARRPLVIVCVCGGGGNATVWLTGRGGCSFLWPGADGRGNLHRPCLPLSWQHAMRVGRLVRCRQPPRVVAPLPQCRQPASAPPPPPAHTTTTQPQPRGHPAPSTLPLQAAA